MTENIIRYASITVDVARTGTEKTLYIGTTTEGWSHVLHEEAQTALADIAHTASNLAQWHWAETVFVEAIGFAAAVGDLLALQRNRSFEVRMVNPARMLVTAG